MPSISEVKTPAFPWRRSKNIKGPDVVSHVTNEMIRELRDLIRYRHDLDLRIWNVGSRIRWYQRDTVRKDIELAETTLITIRQTLNSWNHPQYFESIEIYNKFCEIWNRIMNTDITDWKRYPPWDTDFWKVFLEARATPPIEVSPVKKQQSRVLDLAKFPTSVGYLEQRPEFWTEELLSYKAFHADREARPVVTEADLSGAQKGTPTVPQVLEEPVLPADHDIMPELAQSGKITEKPLPEQPTAPVERASEYGQSDPLSLTKTATSLEGLKTPPSPSDRGDNLVSVSSRLQFSNQSSRDESGVEVNSLVPPISTDADIQSSSSPPDTANLSSKAGTISDEVFDGNTVIRQSKEFRVAAGDRVSQTTQMSDYPVPMLPPDATEVTHLSNEGVDHVFHTEANTELPSMTARGDADHHDLAMVEVIAARFACCDVLRQLLTRLCQLNSRKVAISRVEKLLKRYRADTERQDDFAHVQKELAVLQRRRRRIAIAKKLVDTCQDLSGKFRAEGLVNSQDVHGEAAREGRTEQEFEGTEEEEHAGGAGGGSIQKDVLSYDLLVAGRPFQKLVDGLKLLLLPSDLLEDILPVPRDRIVFETQTRLYPPHRAQWLAKVIDIARCMKWSPADNLPPLTDGRVRLRWRCVGLSHSFSFLRFC